MSYCARGPRDPPFETQRRRWVYVYLVVEEEEEGKEEETSLASKIFWSLVNISCINNGLDEARPRNSDPNCCANLHCSSAKNNKLWWRTWFLGWPMNLYCTSPFLTPYSRDERILINDSILALYLSDRNCMIVSMKPGSTVIEHVLILL